MEYDLVHNCYGGKGPQDDAYLRRTIYHDRNLCSAKNPMPENAEGRWSHDGAQIEDSDSDYYTYWKCVDCGTRWKVELPE